MAAEQIASLFVKIGADLTSLNAGLATTETKLMNAGATMQSVGAKATLGLTVPLLGIGGAAVKATSELDREMRNIQSISKDTDENIGLLSATFVKMSTDLTKTTDTASGLARAFYDIQSSGFFGADAMNVLGVSTKAASAGLSDTQTAARAIMGVLNAYVMPATEAARVSDVLFKTVDVGVLTFADLATNLGDVISSAAVAKVPIEEVGAAFATLTKAGISAPEAATALNRVLLSFISPADGAKKAANALGINLSATAIQTKGLAGVMADLTAKAGGNAEALAAIFPESRALKGALALTRGEMKPFTADLKTMGVAAGATQRAFEIQTRSFSAEWANLKNTLTALSITIGNRLMPPLRQLIDRYIRPAINWVRGLDDKTLKLGLAFAGIGVVLGPVLMVLGTFATLLGGLLSPIGLVLAAVAGLGVAYATNFLGIRDALSGVKTWVDQNWPKAKTWLTGAFEDAQGWFADTWPGVRDDILKPLATGGLDVVLGKPKYSDAERKSMADALGVSLNDIPIEREGGIVGALQGAWDWIKTEWPKVRDDVAKPFAAGLTEGIRAELPGLKTTTEVALADIGKSLTVAWDAVVKLGLIFQFPEPLMPEWQRLQMAQMLGVELSDIPTTIKAKPELDWEDIGGKAALWAGQLWKNITGALAGVAKIGSGGIEVLTGLLESISKGQWTDTWRKGWGDIAQGAWDLLTVNFKNLVFGSKTILGVDLEQVHKNVTEALQKFGHNVGNSIWDGLKSAWADVTTWFNNLKNDIPQWLKDLLGIEGAVATPGAAFPNVTPGTDQRSRGEDVTGWYAGGLDGIFNRPTKIGVGESGPERVTVTPVGKGAAPTITVNIYANGDASGIERAARTGILQAMRAAGQA
jgi:TP901 family phage tail tape measure protein